MKKLSQRLKNSILFLWLLPVFFVLHGYTDYFPFIPIKDAALLLLFYLFVSVLLWGAGFWFFKKKFNAALYIFLLLSFYFFFGPAQDALKKVLPGSFITRYSFILPATLVFFIFLLIVLKKRKKNLFTITAYLNILLIALLAAEFLFLTGKILNSNSNASLITNEFKACPECSKPDVWLIIADGYAGKEELDSVLQFDNSSFENQLKQRGFYITENSSSNYNYTPFSVASLLDMSFIDGIKGKNSDSEDVKICFRKINNNATLRFFKNSGYRFYNYSIFDFDGHPSVAQPTFLPTKTRPLISQTFLYRVQRDLWFHLVTDLKFSTERKKLLYRDLKNNKRIYELSKKTATEQSAKPRFIYTHLMMPHYPYYFDSTGKERPFEKITEINMNDTSAYKSYLKYANTKLLELVDQIQQSSVKPPVIVLMGDHGLREFSFKVAEKYYFSTLNAVYLPGGNYSDFYKGLSHINQFRILFNTQFRQNLPRLKDSTRLIIE